MVVGILLSIFARLNHKYVTITMIFNFSGTGNSRWAAMYLAKALKEKVVNIADAMKADSNGEPIVYDNLESIGFVFPVNGWMPPKIVRQFVKKLKIQNAERVYCYVIMTAGDCIGNAMDVMKKDLQSVGLDLHAAFSLIMPESYVCLPGFNTDDEEKAKWKLNDAAHDIEIYTEYIIHRRKGVSQITKGPVPWILTYILGIPFNKMFISDKPFKVSATKCTHCGTCAKVCPVGNISYNNDKLPVWKCDGTCTNCMACYHHCPVHAIDHRTTKNKGQYVFPEARMQKLDED